jgi:predicted metal-dependent peptidase
MKIPNGARVNHAALGFLPQDESEVLAKARQKMRFGVDYIYEEHPIGVPFIAQVKIKAAPSCGTMCVNGVELRYDPVFVNRLSVNAVKWVVLHEMMHLMLGHHIRRGERNVRGYNIAGDLSINHLLLEYLHRLDVYKELVEEFGLLMPRREPYTNIPAGLSSEDNYRRLEQDAVDQMDDEQQSVAGQDESDDESDDGSASGDGDGDGDGQESSDSGDNSQGDGDKPGNNGEQGESKGTDLGNCKSMTEVFDEQLDGKQLIGEVADSPVISEEGIDVAEEQYEATAVQAVQLMKEQGKGAGYGIAMIEEIITKKAVNDWRKLREMITKTTLGGINYKRQHRRRTVKHSFVPANRSRGKTKGVLVVDTSGSMGTHEMDEAFVQMSQLFREWPKAEVTMVQCDAVIHNKGIKDYTYNDLPIRIPREWYGNGGTEMQPGVDWIKERRSEYDWAIFVTDMGFSYNSLTESGVPTFFVGVNARAGIELPQKSYHYIPVVVEA